MRRLIQTSAILCATFGLVGPVSAQTAQSDSAVVVELYTSQGCSSCPPADAFLSELVGRGDVIALALHVDYWDYIGWKDTFGSPAFTQRQYDYATAAGSRTVYTPQFIIGGSGHIEGSNPADVARAVRDQMAGPQAVSLTLRRDGGKMVLNAQALAPLPKDMVVQIIHYVPEAKVAIAHGENAGRTVTYHNIVTAIDTVGAWDGQAPFAATAKAGDGPVVAIVQARNLGPILAAARLP